MIVVKASISLSPAGRCRRNAGHLARSIAGYRHGAALVALRDAGALGRSVMSTPNQPLPQDRMSDQGHYLEDLQPGMTASLGKTVTDADLVLFAGVSGDTNPVHLDEEFAQGTMFKGRIAHGMLIAGVISAVLGTRLPGPGAIYVSQSMKFLAPVRVGDTLKASVTVRTVDHERRRVILDTECRVRDTKVLVGEATLMVQRRPREAA
jgi:3-hydroxybutyryl-CoA dehydratase